MRWIGRALLSKASARPPKGAPRRVRTLRARASRGRGAAASWTPRGTPLGLRQSGSYCHDSRMLAATLDAVRACG